jgi:hypothetical protein
VTAAELLRDLTALGFAVTPDGGGLRVAPASRLTPSLRAAVRAYKEELRGLLAAPPGTSPPGPPASAGAGARGGAEAGGLSDPAPDAATAPMGARMCPRCGRPRDAKGRCWACCDRHCCDCGRPTGSAFIARCVACGHRLSGNRGEPV